MICRAIATRRALEAFNRQNLVPFEGFGLRFGVRCWTPTE
jgi:hypothetical protein